MDRSKKSMQDRRRFFQTLIRGGIFASLAGLGGLLIKRYSDAGDCRQNYGCSACGLSDRCQLPEADRHRLEKARNPKTSQDHGRAGK